MDALFYLSPLLIYFPQIVPGIETQPWATLGLSVFGLARARGRGLAAFAILLLVFSTLAALGQMSGWQAGSGQAYLLLAGPLIFFGAMEMQLAPPGRNAIRIVIALLIMLAALEILLPSVYGAIAAALLDRFNVANGIRGITLLTPEPTYAAILLVYLLVLSRWSQAVHGYRDPATFGLLLLLTVATFSSYAMLLLLVLFLASNVSFPIKLALFSGLLMIALASSLVESNSIRAFALINILREADLEDILASMSVLDPSISSRIIANLATYKTPLFAPFGLGLGCDSLPVSFQLGGFDFAFDNEVLSASTYGCLKGPSYISNLLLAFGILAAPLIFCFVALIRLVSGEVRSITWNQARLPFAAALFILSAQVQLVNPIPWLILYISLKHKNE